MNKRNYTEEYFKIKLKKREKRLAFWGGVIKILCAIILAACCMVFPFLAGYVVGLEGLNTPSQIASVVTCFCVGLLIISPLTYAVVWCLKDDGE